jgi:esterase
VVIPSYLSQFNYQITGPESGRKWVFLHGLMGYYLNWRKIISDLEKTERVLAYDQRGHGKSMKPMTGYSAEDYAEDLYLILEDLKWNKIILVGHSMGGRNALMFAHKFPEKVEKLVISDIGPEGDPNATEYYKKLLGLVPTPFVSKKEAKEFFLNEFPQALAKLGSHENAQTLGGYFYANMVEDEIGHVNWRFHKQAILDSVQLGRAKDHWSELRSLPMPTLIVRGENSTELSSETYQKMQLSNPRIKGIQINDAGHWVHADQPLAFLNAIKDFVGL